MTKIIVDNLETNIQRVISAIDRGGDSSLKERSKNLEAMIRAMKNLRSEPIKLDSLVIAIDRVHSKLSEKKDDKNAPKLLAVLESIRKSIDTKDVPVVDLDKIEITTDRILEAILSIEIPATELPDTYPLPKEQVDQLTPIHDEELRGKLDEVTVALKQIQKILPDIGGGGGGPDVVGIKNEDEDGRPLRINVATEDKQDEILEKMPVLEPNGGVPVNLQDQTTPTMIVPLSKVSNTTALSVGTSLDATTITLDDATGFVAETLITIADPINNRYYVGRQIGAVSGNEVTLDTPLDFAYPSGSQVTAGSHNLAVDGSITTQVFSLRAGDSPIGVPIYVDVTRLIFKCLTTSAVDLSTFGDLPKLLNGLVVRKVDGSYNNIFNVHDNGELASIMYDFTVYAKSNPVQGQDGFLGRLTFGGQNKLGVVIRIGPGEDLEALVQDDLRGLITLEIIAEGHVVTD